jgi:hypothetical protein
MPDFVSASTNSLSRFNYLCQSVSLSIDLLGCVWHSVIVINEGLMAFFNMSTHRRNDMTLINTLSENAIARISQAVGATVKADKAMTSALDTLAADGIQSTDFISP